jgi:hypothetical protein
LGDTDTKVFYWNLHGAKSFFEGSNDQNFAVSHDGQTIWLRCLP